MTEKRELWCLLVHSEKKINSSSYASLMGCTTPSCPGYWLLLMPDRTCPACGGERAFDYTKLYGVRDAHTVERWLASDEPGQVVPKATVWIWAPWSAVPAHALLVCSVARAQG